MNNIDLLENIFEVKFENYQKVILNCDKKQIRKVLFGRPQLVFSREIQRNSREGAFSPARNERRKQK